MTVHLFTHPLSQAGERAVLVHLNALRALREELAAFPGVRVAATPRGADLEVEIVSVTPCEEFAGMAGRDAAARIMVVRMRRNGEQLDFVCSDGHGGVTAERQAARRIRNWVAGEDFLSLVRNAPTRSHLQAIA